jgi:hypothetical protein
MTVDSMSKDVHRRMIGHAAGVAASQPFASMPINQEREFMIKP